jgi:TonB dependent receptor
MKKIFIIASLFVLLQSIYSQTKDTTENTDPLYQKPFLLKYGSVQLGGYTDVSYEFERENGITEEATFKANRFNVFVYSRFFSRATIFAEIEFEEGAEEISLEIAQLDFEFDEALNLRAGILLPPIGRFNVNHDSPKNDFTRRPLVSTEIIPSTLSEVGGGLFGNIYAGKMRFVYNMYLTNGMTDGLILNSQGRTNFQEGKPSLGEDNNNTPSYTGRIGFIPIPGFEAGFSFHTGTYNTYSVEGVDIDEKRNETILAADWDISRSFKFGTLRLTGEYAYAEVDVPENLTTIYAGKQQGFYIDLAYDFMKGIVKILPKSYFTFALRYDEIHLNKDIKGDIMRQFSLGLNFRPIEDMVFRVNYSRGWTYDKLYNLTHTALMTASFATYF